MYCVFRMRSDVLMRGVRPFLAAVGLVGCSALPAAAQQYPRFTGERLYLVGAPDTGFGTAMESIRQVEREAPETYYLVVARSTGSGGMATRDYTDELYQRWQAEARGSGRKLDPDRHVIMVIGITNRQISVHAGVRLQNDLGFTGATIDREVVQPVFIPHAKAGDYPRGASALVRAIDQWLRRAEAARAQAARQREAQRLQERAAVASGIRTEQSELARIATRLTAEGRSGLATGGLEQALAGIGPLLAQAEALAHDQPQPANAALRKARDSRRELEQRLAALREWKQRAGKSLEDAQEALKSARAELERAQAEGLAGAGLAEQLQGADAAQERAGRSATTDYERSYADSRTAADQARDLLRRIELARRARAAAERRRIFLSRTLPLGLAAALVLLLLAAATLLRVRHLRLRREVVTQLDGLLRRLVACMERIEALTERHKLLLGADPDFTAPMAGRTLALYDETEATLRSAWGVWDALVASRDQIQKLLAGEHPLGRKGLQAAQGRLRELERSGELAALLDTVSGNLDGLNNAHEGAREVIATLTTEIMEADSHLTAVKSAPLPTAPYGESRQQAAGGATRAAELLEADPLSARELAEQTGAGAAELNSWLVRVLSAVVRHGELVTRAALLETEAAARRSEGYLLTEPGGNPDPLLAEARKKLSAAWEQLTGGADAPAAELLAAAESLAQQGESTVTEQISARAFCEQDLPARRAETQRLADHLRRAEAARQDLAGEFAASCWQPVAGHCAAAVAALPEFDRLCSHAESLAGPRTQRYLEARETLRQVAGGQATAESGMTAVEQTLGTLRAIRSRVQADTPRVMQLLQAVHAYAAANSQSLRAAARERQAEGQAALDGSAAAAALPPPDWVNAARQLQQAEALLAAAQAEAQQDVAAHRRVLERLVQAEQACAAAEAFIQRETGDRPAAAQRLQQSLHLLRESGSAAEVAGADWPGLESQLDQSIELAESAHRMAKEDVRLLSQAQSELESAARAVRAAEQYFGHGIRGNTGQAAGALQLAVAALSGQQYEEVIRTAGEAAMLAQAAERAARAQVRQIEEEIRRRREEEARRARAAEEARRSSFSASSHSSSSSFSSGTSSSSSGSGTSQSSW